MPDGTAVVREYGSGMNRIYDFVSRAQVVDYFDAKGRLLRRVASSRVEDGYSIQACHDGGHVASIEDSAGRRLLDVHGEGIETENALHCQEK